MAFGSISMLAWGLVVVVPIVLHLLRKRKSRTIAWGAMQFLRAAMVRRAKRFQLWRLLLLFLRMAAIMALAFSLTRPLFREEAGADGDAQIRQRILNVLVFDGSYSMRATGEPSLGRGVSRFEIAKQTAIEVLNSADTGDGFLLMQLEDDPEWIGSRISFRSDEVGATVKDLRPGEGIANLTRGFLALERAIEDVRNDGWQGVIRVFLFSDLQATSWESVNVQEVTGRILGGKAGAESEILVVDCRPPAALTNVQVRDLSVRRDGAGAGLIVEARIGVSSTLASSLQADANANNDAKSGVFALAQLVIDGRVDQSQRVEIRKSGNIVDWKKRLSAGRHVVEVRLAAEDAIVLDNKARQIITRRDDVKVALFADSKDVSRYLELALSAGVGAAEAGGNSPFDVTQYTWGEVAKADLGRESVWVLCDPVPPSPQIARRLEQHVKRGGSVVWWLGSNWRVDQSKLNSDSLQADAWRAIGDVAGEDDDVTFAIDPLDYQAPIVRPFQPYPGAGLLTLPVFRFWRLELGSAWNVSLGVTSKRFDETTLPLIATLDRRAGGREVIVTTPPGPGIRAGGENRGEVSDQPWNALIAWPAFLPLVREMMYWVVAGEEVPAAFMVGQPIAGTASESEMGTAVVGSSGQQLAVEVTDRSGSQVRWTAGIAEFADVYRWANGPSSGEPLFAVNVDPREGLLKSQETVHESLQLVRADEVVASIDRVDTAASSAREADVKSEKQISAGSGNGDIGWCLLLVALAILLSESALVGMLENRF